MKENSCFFAVVVTFIVIVLICCVPFVLQSKPQDPRIGPITWDPQTCMLSWSYWNEQGDQEDFSIKLHEGITGAMTDGKTAYPLERMDQLATHQHLDALTIYAIQSTNWFHGGGKYEQRKKPEQDQKVKTPNRRPEDAGLLLSAVASALP